MQHVATDTDWQALPSAITDDQLYDGEDIDGRGLVTSGLGAAGHPETESRRCTRSTSANAS